MSRLLKFFEDPAARRRILLLGLCAALALFLGFRLLTPATAARVITEGGYYYILAVFGCFCAYAGRVALSRQEVWKEWLRRPGWPGLVLAVSLLFVAGSDSFRHKIIFDEYDLQGTAFEMHSAKEVGTILRAYPIAGTWVTFLTFLDKRPYFYPFLVSLLHDLTGFRVANAFVLNMGLGAMAMGLAYWLAKLFAGRGPALMSVVLLATTPLFIQNATDASMDIHNLAMILLVTSLAVLYLRAPDGDRAALLVLTTVLLAESRYESVIYIGPVTVILVMGWLRAGRMLLPWPAIVAPLLLVPYALHNRVLTSQPFFWQLQPGQTAPFSTAYVANNLRGAAAFFFNIGTRIPNSWYLTLLGLAGTGCVIWRAVVWLRTRPRLTIGPEGAAAFAMMAGVGIQFGILMFYWWARFDNREASRLALPLCGMLAILAAVFLGHLESRGISALRFARWGFFGYVCISALPVTSLRLYTEQNELMHQIEWDRQVIESCPGPVLFISPQAPMPYMLWRIPTLITNIARGRLAQIRYHMKVGTFKDILISQTLSPTTRNGDMVVDPDEELPDECHLVTVAEKDFGGHIDRISRIVEIDPPKTPAMMPAVAQ